MNKSIQSLVAVFAITSAGLLASSTSNAADKILNGKIKSASGEALAGVTVSATAEGSTVT